MAVPNRVYNMLRAAVTFAKKLLSNCMSRSVGGVVVNDNSVHNLVGCEQRLIGAIAVFRQILHKQQLSSDKSHTYKKHRLDHTYQTVRCFMR